jgi:UDP-N-acetylglucosamine 4,6-dehydratase
MISVHDARRTLDMGELYVIKPEMDWFPHQDYGGKPVADDFAFVSDTNDRWLGVDELRTMAQNA